MNATWGADYNPFAGNGVDPDPLPNIWDAADVLSDVIPPREWLLGTTFCKGFTSSIVGAGAAGKTAARIVQGLSVATGRKLTGEFVHKRAKVLFLSFEDGESELKRRILAAFLHHRIGGEDARGWMSCVAIVGKKLFTADQELTKTQLFEWLERTITEGRFELVILDPFIKVHATDENDNSGIEQVCAALSYLAVEKNIAVDFPHHVRKGIAEPGDADMGRGASAAKDAGRLGYTLTTMSPKMAEFVGVKEESLRRSLVRMDSAKVNIAPPTVDTVWFRLVGVSLGNSTADYPHGDTVQTVERWYPPDAKLSSVSANEILDVIDKGVNEDQRYSSAPNATERAAWKVVQQFCPTWTEAQCRQLITQWLKRGALRAAQYDDPKDRKLRQGLWVGTRPNCDFVGF